MKEILQHLTKNQVEIYNSLYRAAHEYEISKYVYCVNLLNNTITRIKSTHPDYFKNTEKSLEK